MGDRVERFLGSDNNFYTPLKVERVQGCTFCPVKSFLQALVEARAGGKEAVTLESMASAFILIRYSAEGRMSSRTSAGKNLVSSSDLRAGFPPFLQFYCLCFLLEQFVPCFKYYCSCTQASPGGMIVAGSSLYIRNHAESFSIGIAHLRFYDIAKL